MRALPFSYDRELSAEQNNIAVFDLSAAVTASGLTEINRKQFEGRGGRYLTFTPNGSQNAVFLEVAFDNPDDRYFSLNPGSFINTEPYKWSRLYVRVIPIQPSNQYSGAVVYLGQLIAADHFVVDYKGASPPTALYIHEPTYIGSCGWEQGPFPANPFTSRVPGGAGNLNDYMSVSIWAPNGDPRNISTEIEITNTSAGLIYAYQPSDGGGAIASGIAPTSAIQLYPITAGEKQTFYLGYDYNASHNILAGTSQAVNQLYIFSDQAGSSYTWKRKEYR